MGIYHAPVLRNASNVAGWFGRTQASSVIVSAFVLVAGSRLQNDSSLIVGGSAFLRHLETSVDGLTTFQVSGASVNILQPDGTLYSGALSVQTFSSSAALTQELRAVWTPAMGGMHRVEWTFQVSGVTITRVEQYFVAWTDVWSIIRRRLRETSMSLPDVDIDSEVTTTVRQLVDRFSLLQQQGGYEGLVGLDQERFDTGAAYLTALAMRYYRMKTVPIGEVQTVKVGPNEFGYRQGQQAAEQSIEDVWLQEGLLSLGRVTAIQTTYASAASSFKPFVVSGPTRHKLQQGHYETLMSSVLRLISDRWNDGEDAPDYYDGYGQI